MSKIHVIGIGYKPLLPEEEEILKRVPHIFVFASTVELFKKYPLYPRVKEKLRIIKGTKELLSFLKENSVEEVGILATGDPLVYGIGETLLKHIPKEALYIYPDLSTVNVFCAKLKILPSSVKIFSLHGRTFSEELFFSLLLSHPYLFVFTDSTHSPSFIARYLLKASLDYLKLYVGERLGSFEERIYSGPPKDFIDSSFKEPNCVLIENPKWGKNIIFGYTEEEILHLKGMITKDEIRAIVLHKLRLPLKGIFWDIGAGSGSISLEVAKLSPELKVYAIEEKDEFCKLLEENKKKLQVPNLEIVCGEAPNILSALPLPERIFIGGSGGRLREILEYLLSIPCLKIIVATFVTLENLKVAEEILKQRFSLEVFQVQINKLSPLKDYHYFKALNPIFILRAKSIEF